MYDPIKRIIDILVGGTLLLVLAPLLAVAALAVLVSMGRPVLFRQERPGRHGQPFCLVKFRTMRTGSGADAERLTAVGRFLRSTSIDELPELWDVVKGDMSLIGPRPLLMEYLPLYDERQAQRHLVKPGISGLAQVNGRNQLDWNDRLEMDARYVETRSLAVDIQIAAKTVVQVFQRSGISAHGEATMPRFRGSTPAQTSTTQGGSPP